MACIHQVPKGGALWAEGQAVLGREASSMASPREHWAEVRRGSWKSGTFVEGLRGREPSAGLRELREGV